MKLALLSPTFPPKICGVGDHSFFLSAALAKAGHEITIFTRQTNAAAPPPNVKLEVVTKFQAESILSQKPDCVLVQYTPYLHSSLYGLAPGFLLELIQMRSQTRLAVLAHELYYPLELSRAGVFVAPLQHLQFYALARIAHKTVFTYEAPNLEYQDPRRFSWLPVGANIQPPHSVIHNSPTNQLNPADPVILHFGGAHPTHLYTWIEAAAGKIQAQYPEARFICLGIQEEELRKCLGGQKSRFWRALGKLPAAEIAQWIQKSDLVLAPFLDGISTRRGSAMAAFAQGRAVVTNRSYSTNSSVPWADFSFIAEKFSPEEYANLALSALVAANNRQEKAQKALAYYEKYFSWQFLAQALPEKILSS